MPLVFENVTFSYRRSGRLFDRLTLSFHDPVTVVLGPNGAGKSTLLGIAATAIRPDSGRVSLDGLVPARKRELAAYRRRVSWIPQQVTAVPGLRVREQVAYCGWLKGLSRSEAWDRSIRALERVELGDLAGRASGKLSGGQQRRMAIAQALVHEASWVLMDEPTAGLDPGQRQVFRRLIAELRETAQIIVSTHQTDDLDTVFDHVVLLAHGRVHHDGGLQSFLGMAPEGTPETKRAELAYARYVGNEA
ncbi:ATP-binding cassette domain-containing protein [Phytoactinopolyspora halotolerans]|uniref:ATP-binding cassette domain-containing protein n=1 Tax=Phytoactinopolyspora halotolerans TaxID=1981512 RepID=A0A6L9SFP0_9ACTN|nr:ATP-binding cassette domain-containing protein [Phytoactinopolyspora halotolerans]NEE03448.1 ATP-binding cassette domain-containing protein [Phytoactinopolyspora halotolerans]